jgi:hypothetical protein
MTATLYDPVGVRQVRAVGDPIEEALGVVDIAFLHDDGTVSTKPATTTKQRRVHRAPISGAEVALLRTGCGLPGDADRQPFMESKRS